MKTAQLLDDLEFHDEHAYAQPLFVAETGRVLRFLLKPGQSIHEHDVPSSPFFVVVLKGKGLFAREWTGTAVWRRVFVDL